jgi:hypothetical protein
MSSSVNRLMIQWHADVRRAILATTGKTSGHGTIAS